MNSYQDRPVVDGREQRYRWELRRVDPVRRCYTFVHDVRTYSEACLYADVAVRMLGGDFVVWDNVDKRTLYDSRKMRAKFEDDRPTIRNVASEDEGGNDPHAP